MTVTVINIAECTIIDPQTGRSAIGILSIEGSKIVDATSSEGGQIDGRGLFAIPGLIDMHVHTTSDPLGRTASSWNQISPTTESLLAVDNLATALRNGVTSVRDLGAKGSRAYDIRAAWDRGLFVGARPFVAGPVITTVGGHGNWLGVESNGLASVGALVRRNLADGSDVIKLMMKSAARRMELRPEEVREAIAEAHWGNVPVAIHANFSARSIDTAVSAGCDTLEHGYAISEETARLMASQKTFLCSTATALQSIVDNPDAWIRRGGRALVERAIEQYPEARLSFERALQAGVIPIAGTDAGVTGVSFGMLARELKTLTGWGASPLQALQAATSGASQALRRPEFGTLASGTPADIVLLRTDPREDIAACTEVEAVIQSGRLIRIESESRVDSVPLSSAPGTVLPEDAPQSGRAA